MTGDKGLVATTSGSGAAREATSASPGWTGAVGEPTRLLLLRHGQTPMSIDRRYSGSSSNPSLTDFGRRQARAAAERLALGDWDIRGIIVSPQARALETAEYASRLEHQYLNTGMHSGRFRTPQEIGAFFDGLELVEPGLVPLDEWWPAGPPVREPGVERLGLGGVARKP